MTLGPLETLEPWNVGTMEPGEWTGFSRALYSNWFWHRPLQLLIDAGEGLPIALGTSVYSPSVVAITHGHSDHVLGLPGFVGARRFGKGAPDKPYTVLYPSGSSGVRAIRDVITNLWKDVIFPIDWIAMQPGDTHPLGGKRTVEAFEVSHVVGEPALGYRVLENRRRLTAEHAGKPSEEIERLARLHGRESLMEFFDHAVFVHSGDAMPIDISRTSGADLLVHDATFLGSAERREPIHATSEEALEVARVAAVRALVLNHLSIRYERPMAIERLREQVHRSGFRGSCWLLDEAKFITLSIPPKASSS